ncbi:MAG: endonuclease/exonuclease/phosphatase family protein [Bacteroidia bacterium]|nr:endonuclease/exonuclease/phosphatase family protein [Bacteroidia bacterium]
MKLIHLLLISTATVALVVNCVPKNQLNDEANNHILSVAFYNLDNLFDTIDDISHNDDDFTPNGKYGWSNNRYLNKLRNLQRVIDTLIDGNSPDVFGVCELESALAFKDLMDSNSLLKAYQLVHFDSPDERGIDVALAFNRKKMSLINALSFKVKLSLDSSDKTRDILYVKTKSTINNDTFNFLVCHFPSRREGKLQSEQNRIDAAKTLKSIINQNCSPNSNIVIMGDFNDQPWDKSLSSSLNALSRSKCPDCFLHNLMFELKNGSGSYRYKGHWERLDQIIISKALTNGLASEYIENSLSIVQYDWMIQDGNYKGYPLRTFGGTKWLNGFSDHLPVYIKIALNN